MKVFDSVQNKVIEIKGYGDLLEHGVLLDTIEIINKTETKTKTKTN